MKGEGQGLDSPDIVYYCTDQNNISAVANPAKSFDREEAALQFVWCENGAIHNFFVCRTPRLQRHERTASTDGLPDELIFHVAASVHT